MESQEVGVGVAVSQWKVRSGQGQEMRSEPKKKQTHTWQDVQEVEPWRKELPESGYSRNTGVICPQKIPFHFTDKESGLS